MALLATTAGIAAADFAEGIAPARQATTPVAETLQDAARKAGDVFRDCPECLEMVVIPAGSFVMGSPPGEQRRTSFEGPQHPVTIQSPFALGVYEVTFDEWDACLAAGGCGGHRLDDESWGRGTRPVINVTWNEAQLFIEWLRNRTGKGYRLPSEAEWEYAARAGTTTVYSWGDDLGKGNANCAKCGSTWDGNQTAPTGSFKANPFGLWDMHGNVMEWTQDCDHYDYEGAPSAGESWEKNCSTTGRIMRGGSWGHYPYQLRAAMRDSKGPDRRLPGLGFRVARNLTP